MSLPNWTKQFKISVGLLAFLSLLLFGLYKYVAMRLAKSDSTHSVAVLPNKDKERITFNEKTHVLMVQTSKGTIKEYAKNPDIQIQKDETVKINRHLSGFENNLFIGAGYGDTGRILLGDNLVHFGRIDLGGAIAWSPDANVVAFKPVLTLGYNVWDNVSVGVGVNALSGLQTKGVDMIGFVSIKL